MEPFDQQDWISVLAGGNGIAKDIILDYSVVALEAGNIKQLP
jgi:hypothetical protein